MDATSLNNMTITSQINIFISYCHDNYIWVKEWENDSGTVRNPKDLPKRWEKALRKYNVSCWFDCDNVDGLHGGDLWEKRIFEKIDTADIAVLLVTQEFVASSYIMDIELPRIINRSKNNNLVVLPVLVQPTRIKDLPDAELYKWQWTPNASQSLSEAFDHSPSEFDKMRIVVLDALERLVVDVRDKREIIEKKKIQDKEEQKRKDEQFAKRKVDETLSSQPSDQNTLSPIDNLKKPQLIGNGFNFNSGNLEKNLSGSIQPIPSQTQYMAVANTPPVDQPEKTDLDLEIEKYTLEIEEKQHRKSNSTTPQNQQPTQPLQPPPVYKPIQPPFVYKPVQPPPVYKPIQPPQSAAQTMDTPSVPSMLQEEFDPFEDDAFDDLTKRSPLLRTRIILLIFALGITGVSIILFALPRQKLQTVSATVKPQSIPTSLPAPFIPVETPKPEKEGAPVDLDSTTASIIKTSSKPMFTGSPDHESILLHQIVFTSTPTGALITIDYQKLGVTPFIWKKPVIGKVNVQISKLGYKTTYNSFDFTGGNIKKNYMLENEVVSSTPMPPPAIEPEIVRQPQELETVIKPTEDKVSSPTIVKKDDPVAGDMLEKPTVERQEITTPSSGGNGEAHVFIASIPPVAEVFLGEKLIGRTNVGEMIIPTGVQTLNFVKGDKKLTQQFTFEKGKNPSKLVRLLP